MSLITCHILSSSYSVSLVEIHTTVRLLGQSIGLPRPVCSKQTLLHIFSLEHAKTLLSTSKTYACRQEWFKIDAAVWVTWASPDIEGSHKGGVPKQDCQDDHDLDNVQQVVAHCEASSKQDGGLFWIYLTSMVGILFSLYVCLQADCP